MIIVSPPVPIGLGFGFRTALGLGLGLGLRGPDLGLGLDNNPCFHKKHYFCVGALERSESFSLMAPGCCGYRLAALDQIYVYYRMFPTLRKRRT